jgi:signal transduction histidine kinase
MKFMMAWRNILVRSMRLAVAREVLSSPGSEPIRNLDQAIELVNLGLAEARRCAHNLRYRAIEESALRPELQRLTERWSINGRALQFQLRRHTREQNIKLG